MAEHTPPLLLIGCGNMGGALFEAWVAAGLAPSVVLDRKKEAIPAPHRLVRSAAEIPADFTPSVIVLAVKPQTAAQAIADLLAARPDIAANATVLSVMAGATTTAIGAALCGGASVARPAVVRAMPNTPSAIGRGMTGLFAAPGAPQAIRALSESLLAAVGATVWVEREEQIDAVTAVSGSGPAYVFLLAELLERAGVEQGLPADVARLLARKTISGAGELMDRSPDDATQLRHKVTSPGGTTAQAIAVLAAKDAWPTAISEAVAAATRRARELAV